MNDFGFGVEAASMLFVFGFISFLLFLLIVAPIWLIMHYSRVRQDKRYLDADDREDLGLLKDRAEYMDERIETLESILDERTPDWRRRHQE